jgi:hypothetical protein
MADNFETLADSPEQPARLLFSITPHATNEIDPLPKAVFVGSGGTLTCRAADSSADVTLNVQSGQVIDARIRYIRAAGTTASNLVGMA